jgi:hypothetical protein
MRSTARLAIFAPSLFALAAASTSTPCLAETRLSAATPPPPPIAEAKSSPVQAAPGPLRLTGANGREVDFAGIWEARPEGLVALTAVDAPLSLVAWDRFDLERLRQDQPVIDAARQRAIFLRSPQPINLGLFAGLLTPAQAGSELRRILDERLTVKVPLRYRTTTTTSSTTTIVPPRPIIYHGLVLPPPPDAPHFVSQTNRTVSETRFSPDELSTSPRRVLDMLSRTDGVAAQDRRDLLDLLKTNPVLLEETAAALDRIEASLPPRHLLPNDPTLLTLAHRLREFSTGLRRLTTAIGLDHSDRVLMRDLLYLADSPHLR